MHIFVILDPNMGSGGTTNNPFVATFKDQPPIGGDLTKNPFTSSFIPPPGKRKIFPNKCPRPANF